MASAEKNGNVIQAFHANTVGRMFDEQKFQKSFWKVCFGNPWGNDCWQHLVMDHHLVSTGNAFTLFAVKFASTGTGTWCLEGSASRHMLPGAKSWLFSYVNCLQYANTKQMVQITAVYTMDLIWIQVVPNLTVVASTASPTRNRRSEKKLWWVRVSMLLVRNPCQTHRYKKTCVLVVGTKSMWHIMMWRLWFLNDMMTWLIIHRELSILDGWARRVMWEWCVTSHVLPWLFYADHLV